MNNWTIKKLGEILEYEQPTKYLVSSINYEDKYQIPVLTAGKSFVLGNTNEKNGIFPKEKLPVIIFDDFTTAIKFVDFPFKVKSSAMKILHAKKDMADIKYLFNKLLTVKFSHNQHKRYWISECSKIEIPLPPLAIQKQIVRRLDKIAEAQKLNDEIIQKVEELYRSLLNNEINSKFKTQNIKSQFKIKKLGEVANYINGRAFKPTEWVEKGLPIIRIQNLTETQEKFNYFKGKVDNKHLIMNGDILLSWSASLGVYIWNKGRAVLNQHIFKVVPHSNIDKNYLFHTLITAVEELKRRVHGSTMTHVTKPVFNRVNIGVPPIKIQKQIVEKLSAVQEYKKQLLEQKSKLKELFDSVLHKSMKGDI